MSKPKAYLVMEFVVDGQHRVRCVSLNKAFAFLAAGEIRAKYDDFQKQTCTLKIKEFALNTITGIGKVIKDGD